MKKKKWLLLVGGLGVLFFFMIPGVLLFIFALIGSNNADKEDIIAFVCEKEGALLEAIEKDDFSEFENQGMVQKIKRMKNVVDFSCGGAGIGSGTFYVGFYYTEEEDRVSMWWAPSSAGAVVPDEEGFEWREANGDNRYYTEKICENFFYYEAGF